MNKPRPFYRGKNYQDAIKKLKELRASAKLKKEAKRNYKNFMEKICSDFSISVKTIYRDMNQRKVAGLRAVRKDRGKYKSRISKKEKKTVEEVMKAGKTKKTAKEIAETVLRTSISQRKIKRITEKISAPRNSTAPLKPDSNNDESVFGSEAKKFFESFFNYDLIAPEKGVPVGKGKMRFIVKKEDLADIILILSNAYNRSCFADAKKLKVDRDELRDIMMHHLIEEQINLAKNAMDYKMIESITRMLERVKEGKNTANPNDFKTVLNICREIKPDISMREVIDLIKKVSDG